MTNKLFDDDLSKKSERPILGLPNDEEFKGPIVEVPAGLYALAERFKRLMGDKS